jgi:hypothetical protein
LEVLKKKTMTVKNAQNNFYHKKTETPRGILLASVVNLKYNSEELIHRAILGTTRLTSLYQLNK